MSENEPVRLAPEIPQKRIRAQRTSPFLSAPHVDHDLNPAMMGGKKDNIEQQSAKVPKKGCGRNFAAIGPRVLLYSKFALTDYLRRKCLFCIGTFTILICFITTVISQAVISKTPVLFYNTVALDNGELDMVITPEENSAHGNLSLFLNQTQVSKVIRNVTKMPALPRYFSDYSISKLHRSKQGLYVITPDVTEVTFALIDLAKEIESGIDGDDLKEIKSGEMWISSGLAAIAGLKVGDDIFLAFGTNTLLLMLEEHWENEYDQFPPTLELLEVPYKVGGIKSQFKGRFPKNDDFNAVVVFDYNTFGDHLIASVERTFEGHSRKDQIVEFYKTIEWRDFCNQIIINFEDRDEIYLNGNYDTVLEKAIPVASEIVESMTPYPIQMEVPLVEDLAVTKFGNTFISLIMNLILIGLLYLSSFVIYNIMLITVDSKIYESAVQRTIGLTRGNLIALMATNALGYSFMAMIIGFPLGFYCFGVLNDVIKDSGADFEIKYEFSNTAAAVILSILIPLFSALNPIMELLKKNIAFALDKDHSKTSSLKVTVEQTEKSFPWESFAVACLSSFMGASIYLLMPLALLTGQVTLFALIFFGLLLSLLIGLMMILVNFSYLIEKLLLIPLFIEKEFIKTMVQMNLVAHRIRNRRTVVIYGLSLSFINFIYVVLVMQIETSQISRLRQEGSKLSIGGSDERVARFTVENFKTILTEHNLGDFVDYSFVLQNLADTFDQNKVGNYSLLNRGKIVELYNPIYGISSNYYAIAQMDLNKNTDSATEGRTSLTPDQFLFTRFKHGQALFSTNVLREFVIDCKDDDDAIIIEYNVKGKTVTKEITCGAAYTTFSGFFMSRMPLAIEDVEMVISMPTYLTMFNTSRYSGLNQFILDKVLMKMKDEKDKPAVLNILRSYSVDFKFEVFDYDEFISSFDSTNKILDLLFYFVTITSMSLSLFSLISTMASNMIEQRKELAIMRCIGLRRWTIARIYMYESIIVIMTGGVIGITVGMLMGWSIVAQNALFMNSEANLIFPWNLLIIVVVFSILSSVVAAMIPAFRALRQNISQLIKSTN